MKIHLSGINTSNPVNIVTFKTPDINAYMEEIFKSSWNSCLLLSTHDDGIVEEGGKRVERTLVVLGTMAVINSDGFN